MSTEMSWFDAITEVLKKEKRPLHYEKITEKILSEGYRKSTKRASGTVWTNINKDLKSKKPKFAEIRKGVYIFKEYKQDFINNEPIRLQTNVMITSFGRYWHVEENSEKNGLNLVGIKNIKVDFKDQIGIYLLHRGDKIIYVGQTTDSLSSRLFTHLTDNKRGRWDSFSWFGFYQLSKEGNLLTSATETTSMTFNKLADILEAILIEIIEPGLNKKVGNNWVEKEYYQYEKDEMKE